MAMIIKIGLPGKEVEAIGGFLDSDGSLDIPEVSEEGAQVLDELTGGTKHPLWRADIGRFVELKPAATGYYDAEEHWHRHADTLMDEEGKSTGRHGIVITDYKNPDGAYVIGVPL